MKKNGKYILTIIGCGAIGYIIGNNIFNSKTIKKTQDTITWIQYINRLQEFCMNNTQQAKEHFIYLIQKGTDLEDAFNIVVSMNYDNTYSLGIE